MLMLKIKAAHHVIFFRFVRRELGYLILLVHVKSFCFDIFFEDYMYLRF